MTGATGPWPALDAIDTAAMARAQGCEARRIETDEELLGALDTELGDRTAPLVLDVVVAQDKTF